MNTVPTRGARPQLGAYRTHHKVKVGRLDFCPWCGQAPRDHRWETGWFKQVCRNEAPVATLKARVLWAAAGIPLTELGAFPPRVRSRLLAMREEAVARQARTVQGGRATPHLEGSTEGAPGGPHVWGGQQQQLRQRGSRGSDGSRGISALELWYRRAPAAPAQERTRVQSTAELSTKRRRTQLADCVPPVRTS